MRLRKVLIASALLLMLCVAGGMLFLNSLGIFSSTPVYSTNQGAIRGYDTVAYFELGAARRGDRAISHEWNGADWYFSSQAHRALFIANPEKYAPQFGGYCAYAVSQNYTANSDPQVWEIVDQKLYLNFDADVAEQWRADQSERIAAAQQNWPKILRARQ
ncbi:MAG: YHS domain-containing (seleno)protein [Panacagrimonas sp.]